MIQVKKQTAIITQSTGCNDVLQVLFSSTNTMFMSWDYTLLEGPCTTLQILRVNVSFLLKLFTAVKMRQSVSRRVSQRVYTNRGRFGRGRMTVSLWEPQKRFVLLCRSVLQPIGQQERWESRGSEEEQRDKVIMTSMAMITKHCFQQPRSQGSLILPPLSPEASKEGAERWETLGTKLCFHLFFLGFDDGAMLVDKYMRKFQYPDCFDR